MKLRILFSFFLTFSILNNGAAQTSDSFIKWGPNISNKDSGYPIITLGKVNDHYYVFGELDHLFDTERYILKYNKQMGYVDKLSLPLVDAKGRFIKISNVFLLKDKVYFYAHTTSYTDINYMYVSIYDMKSFTCVVSLRLIDKTSKPTMFDKGTFRTRLSPDSSKIALLHTNPIGMNDPFNFEVTVFSSDLQTKLWQKTVTTTYTMKTVYLGYINASVDNQGNVMATMSDLTKGPFEYLITQEGKIGKLLLHPSETMTYPQILTTSNGFFLIGNSASPSKDETLIIAAVDTEKGEFKTPKIIPLRKESGDNPLTIPYMAASNVYIRPDGLMTILFIGISTLVSFDKAAMTQDSYITYGGNGLFKVFTVDLEKSKEVWHTSIYGKNDDMTAIPLPPITHQYPNLNAYYRQGYSVAFSSSMKTYIAYNDCLDNLAYPNVKLKASGKRPAGFVAIIDAKGNLTREVICTEEEEDKHLVQLSGKIIDGNEWVLFRKKYTSKSTHNMGIIKLK